MFHSHHFQHCSDSLSRQHCGIYIITCLLSRLPSGSSLQKLVLKTPAIGCVQLEQPLVLKIVHNLPHGILDAGLVALDLDLGALGCLVGGADAGELGDLSFSCLLVEALGVACLGHLEREVDKDLDEGERLVVGVGGGLGGV